MPTEAFEWHDYEVPVAAGGPRGFSLLAAFEEETPATTTVSLPDLTAFPTPRAKAEILLQSAAEVEHALMVQYLYAAYSLKGAVEVSDAGQKAALDDASAGSWVRVLLGIAREEMGHLMTVQNLLLLLGLAPNFEREDFPPRKDLYPFALHLEPITQKSLAKYVVAEAPSGAEGIDDVFALATSSAGSTINRVGVLYGLLGLVFCTTDQVATGATGDPEWDAMVRQLAEAAKQQAPPEAWHLADDEFRADSVSQQADPSDWQVAHLRVHRMADRLAAIEAIRDVGEQGEGPTGADEQSHFARFLGIFRGGGALPPFPAADGAFVPTRSVPTDPHVEDFTDMRTRRWASLGDLRYGLLLGFLEHYLLGTAEDRTLLTGWIFAEMRSRVGHIARELTAMPRGGAGAGAGAIAFTLPVDIHLPASEAERWGVHRARTEAAITLVEEMRAGDAADAASPYLGALLASDQARLLLMAGGVPSGPVATSFARDIQPLFRPVDDQHMKFAASLPLWNYDKVCARATKIHDRLATDNPDDVMPPQPDVPWTAPQISLFQRWMNEKFPH
jgi:hypothetical protein